MELKEKRAEEMQIQMQMLRVQDAEEYNILKAKLENEIQVGLLLLLKVFF